MAEQLVEFEISKEAFESGAILNVTGVAALAGLGTPAIFKSINRGNGPKAMKFMGRWYIRREDALEWIRERSPLRDIQQREREWAQALRIVQGRK